MIKKLVLTESDFHRIIENSVKLMIQEELLLEDTRIDRTKKIIRQLLGNTYNLDAVVDSEYKLVNNDFNTTWLKYFVYKLRHSLAMMSNSDYNYLPLAARLAYSKDFRLDLDNKSEGSEEVETLKKIMNLIKNDNALFQEVNSNPNITYTQLANRFQQQFEAEKAADSEAANNVEVTDNGYEILEVPDFETAKYYGQFSCSTSKLCYTDSEYTWDKYTHKGLNRVYICLRRGWEDVPEVVTEGNPYDTYGLSMIFAFISPNGELSTSNCRWNHRNIGSYITPDVDKAFTKESLAKTVGAPFNSVFKPFEIDKHEIEKRIIKYITFSDSYALSAFAVGDFVIPDGVQIIPFHLFKNFDKLTSVIIPNSVNKVNVGAFSDCINLEKVVISNNLTEISPFMFQHCHSLKNIEIPNSVKSIDKYSFYYCSGLTDVTMYDNVTSIGDCAFLNCYSLKNIRMSNNITYIGNLAFSNCENLKTIEIPNSVEYIDKKAFSYCESLTSITIPSSVTKIGYNAFNECTFTKESFINNSALDAEENNYWGANIVDNIINGIVIKNRNIISYIGNDSDIKIPNGVTSIGNHAFSCVQSIKSVTIPNSVTKIGNFTFIDCHNLESVIIPSSVTEIGVYPFLRCSPNLVAYIENKEVEEMLHNAEYEGKIEYIK